MLSSQTRSVVTRTYALVAPDGYVRSDLPGWTSCTAHVLISRAMGAELSQYLIDLTPQSEAVGDTGTEEWFFYIVRGAASVNAAPLTQGGFAFVPPHERYTLDGVSGDSQVLVFRKTYEPLGSLPAPSFFAAHEDQAPETPFLGDPHARLKTLLPGLMHFDMAINIFTYDPGATLPFVETHVMEHGMLFLSGGGVYRLDADWHPVTAGDALWIAPYCAQWFIASGPGPARYIYYKNVNRLPA